MSNKNDSLLDIAREVVEESSRHMSIPEIAAKVFEIKGIEATDAAVTQFGIDFMLNGNFICCGTNKRQENVWDLKSRQPVSLLDKDGGYLEDLYEDDEDVKDNILTNDNIYDEDIDKNLEDNNDDEDEQEETDDIAEELGLISEDSDDEDGFASTQEIVIERDDEEDEEENTDGDLEDIVEGTFKE